MDGQKQKVGENGIALQAGGNINYGMSYTEVKDLVFRLFEQNFPKLAETAAEKATQNIKDYIEKLEARLKRDADKIDFNKFSDPNIQYLLNSTILNYARKGNAVNMDFLMDAFLLVVNKETTSLLDIVSEQVISVLPRMTKDCIDVLTIIQYIYGIKIDALSSIEMSELYSKKVCDSLNSSDVYNTQTIPYLISLGATTHGVLARDPYKGVGSQYQEFSSVLEEKEWKEKVQNNCPYLSKLIEVLQSRHLSALILTPMGQLIALMNLKSILQMDIDYKIWVK